MNKLNLENLSNQNIAVEIKDTFRVNIGLNDLVCGFKDVKGVPTICYGVIKNLVQTTDGLLIIDVVNNGIVSKILNTLGDIIKIDSNKLPKIKDFKDYPVTHVKDDIVKGLKCGDVVCGFRDVANERMTPRPRLYYGVITDICPNIIDEIMLYIESYNKAEVIWPHLGTVLKIDLNLVK